MKNKLIAAIILLASFSSQGQILASNSEAKNQTLSESITQATQFKSSQEKATLLACRGCVIDDKLNPKPKVP